MRIDKSHNYTLINTNLVYRYRTVDSPLSFEFGRAITNHVGPDDAICSDCDHKCELHGIFVLPTAIILHLHITVENID